MAAGTIIATLPGARMFHYFQILGRPARMPIQYINDTFTENAEVKAYYMRLLQIASAPAFHGGQWSLRDVTPAEMGNNSFRNILSWQWKQMNTGKMVVINYSNAPAKGRLHLKGVYGPGNRGVYGRNGNCFSGNAFPRLHCGLETLRKQNLHLYGVIKVKVVLEAPPTVLCGVFYSLKKVRGVDKFNTILVGGGCTT